jgi:hypothetical protein
MRTMLVKENQCFVDGAVSHSRVRPPGMHPRPRARERRTRLALTLACAQVRNQQLHAWLSFRLSGADRSSWVRFVDRAASRGRRAYSWHASTSERGRGGLVTHNRDGSNHDTPGRWMNITIFGKAAAPFLYLSSSYSQIYVSLSLSIFPQPR